MVNALQRHDKEYVQTLLKNALIECNATEISEIRQKVMNSNENYLSAELSQIDSHSPEFIKLSDYLFEIFHSHGAVIDYYKRNNAEKTIFLQPMIYNSTHSSLNITLSEISSAIILSANFLGIDKVTDTILNFLNNNKISIQSWLYIRGLGIESSIPFDDIEFHNVNFITQNDAEMHDLMSKNSLGEIEDGIIVKQVFIQPALQEFDTTLSVQHLSTHTKKRLNLAINRIAIEYDCPVHPIFQWEKFSNEGYEYILKFLGFPVIRKFNHISNKSELNTISEQNLSSIGLNSSKINFTHNRQISTAIEFWNSSKSLKPIEDRFIDLRRAIDTITGKFSTKETVIKFTNIGRTGERVNISNYNTDNEAQILREFYDDMGGPAAHNNWRHLNYNEQTFITVQGIVQHKLLTLIKESENQPTRNLTINSEIVNPNALCYEKLVWE